MYLWKKREEAGCLANMKPVPKNRWWALGAEKKEKVIAFYQEYPEISTHYVLGVKAGMSSCSAGKVLNAYLPPEPEVEETVREEKIYEWLKLHVCWSIDTIKYLTTEGWLYIQLLLEEFSRVTLGWSASMENTANQAVMFVDEASDSLGVSPLILKHDRGKEFNNASLRSLLDRKRITLMASPPHYPRFNGKLERNNLLVEKFLPKKGVITVAEVYNRLDRGMGCVNHVLPRQMFGGKTSAQVYAEGKMFEESERETLIRLAVERQAEIELEQNRFRGKLDLSRKAVVKSVVDLGLCSVRTRLVNANQFEVANV